MARRKKRDFLYRRKVNHKRKWARSELLNLPSDADGLRRSDEKGADTKNLA
jgi:hypothetical protein